MKVLIHQIPSGMQHRDIRFLCWEDLEMLKIKFDFTKYEMVFKFELTKDFTYETLDSIFRMLNIEHPSDYKARSLSVSDIVEIQNNEDSKYYFCDSYGWKLLDVK